MTDLWFYAEGKETRGPLPIAELVPVLARIADPRRVMIWRHGFENWKAVEDVQEVAQHVLRPPLTRAPPSLPQEQSELTVREPAVDVEEAAQFKDVKPELTGLGGWLALVGFGLVVGILKLIVSTGKYYSTEVATEAWTKFPTTMWGEAALNGAAFWVLIYTTVLFFRRSRLFPKFFIWQFVISFCTPLVATLWAGFTVGMATGRPMSEFMIFDRQEAREMVAVVISGAVWIPYILKSRRVRNTFTT